MPNSFPPLMREVLLGHWVQILPLKLASDNSTLAPAQTVHGPISEAIHCMQLASWKMKLHF